MLKQSYSHEGHIKWPSAHAELRVKRKPWWDLRYRGSRGGAARSPFRSCDFFHFKFEFAE